jgi:hypothetical protein
MKLEVGMYVRTKKGAIAKIERILYDEVHFNIKPIFSDGECLGYNWFYISDVIKASHSIIDLIEAGDYVNGCKVHRIANCITIILDNEENISWVRPSDIKSIVTKEQFESMSYKVGE